MRGWCTFFILFIAAHVYGVNASVSHAVFKAGDQAYVETSIKIMSRLVVFSPQKENKGFIQASVEILVMIKDGEDIIQYDRSRVNSPLVEVPVDFSYICRLPCQPGDYTIEVEITDLNNVKSSNVNTQEITVNFDNGVNIGGIQMLASFQADDTKSSMVKNGFLMDPIAYNFYNKHFDRLSFYTEVYHTDTEEQPFYLLRYLVQKIKDDGSREDRLVQYKKRQPVEVDPLLFQLDITEIESGDYALNVAVITPKKEIVVENEVVFIRANPEYDYILQVNDMEEPDDDLDFTAELDSAQLVYALKALIPVVNPTDGQVLDIVLSKKDVKAMRLFLFNHFDQNFEGNPKFGYEQYLQVANAVDKKYENGFGHGFESDRGFYFLKYGKPDEIQEVFDDPSAPPYEIWFYNKLVSTGQNNVRFVFYNPDLIENGHRLLHSTARGEWNNPKWEVMLYSNASNEIQGGNPVDATRMQDNWGRQARRLYNDF